MISGSGQKRPFERAVQSTSTAGWARGWVNPLPLSIDLSQAMTGSAEIQLSADVNLAPLNFSIALMKSCGTLSRRTQMWGRVPPLNFVYCRYYNCSREARQHASRRATADTRRLG